MKKLFSLSIIASSILFNHQSRADENYFLNLTRAPYEGNWTYEILKSSITENTNQISLVDTFSRSLNDNVYLENPWIDYSLNKIYFQENEDLFFSGKTKPTGRVRTYSLTDNTWSIETLSSESPDSTLVYTPIKSDYYKAVKSNSSSITTNTSNISTNTTNINKLGEGVAGSTALTAALTALPQTSKDSKLSCGVGTGAYSSRYALGFGCASRLNERVDINAGGSYVFGGSKSYGGGTLDSGVLKAGFVFKLGELNKPNKISFNDKNIIDEKISTLKEDNNNLKAEVEVLKAKNDEIISQNQKLLARLENLENIASKFQSNSEMISVATKD